MVSRRPSIIANGLERPIGLLGASYGAYRATGAALRLEEQGIPVDGMMFLSPNYDDTYKDYDRPDNHKAFTSILPAIAAVAQYQRAHGPISATSGLDPTWQDQTFGFRYAQDFSETDYLHFLETDHPSGAMKKRIAEDLSRISGVSQSYIYDHDFRLNPYTYAQDVFASQNMELSVIDGRLRFPKDAKIPIDPAIGRWQQLYKDAVAKKLAGIGIDMFLDDSYKGVFVGGADWKFDGIWSERAAYAAMATLLERIPNLRVIDCSGVFDLNCPAPRAAYFWHAMSGRTKASLTRATQHIPYVSSSILPHSHKMRINNRFLPMGHQAINLVGRRHVLNVFNEFLRQITESRV